MIGITLCIISFSTLFSVNEVEMTSYEELILHDLCSRRGRGITQRYFLVFLVDIT